jgi:SAM-dependent methyltransferase
LDDVTGTWRAMPKSQAVHWYAAVLRHAPTVLRERKFYSADADMSGKLRFNLLGRDFTVDVDAINSTAGNGYAFLREFFVRRIYFRAFQRMDFDTCMDLGCNMGAVSMFLRQLGGPNGRVVGVDPLTYPGSTFRAMAVATPGFTFDQRVLCGESIRHNQAALHAMCDPYDFDVRLAATVEEVMDAHDLRRINFLKMDIEGAEFDIFRDSSRWLDRVENLAMEVHNQAGDPRDIIQRLEQAGFRVKWLDDSGYPVEPRYAGYIYASKTGALKS